jgi:hypothetical protein
MSIIAAATFITVAALVGAAIGRHIENRLLTHRMAAMQRTINGLVNAAVVRNQLLVDVAWAVELYETTGSVDRLIYAARKSAHKQQEHNR